MPTGQDCHPIDFMYRLPRHRPPSNPREHIQRNLYARSNLQRRKLFQNSTPKFKNKLTFLFAGAIIIWIALRWGNIIANLIIHSAADVKERNGDTSSNTDHDDLFPKSTSVTDTVVSNQQEVPSTNRRTTSTSQHHIQHNNIEEAHEDMHPMDPDDTTNEQEKSPSSSQLDDLKCSFRKYKPHRYYNVNDTSQNFLSDAQYIRGALPFVINPRSQETDSLLPKKLCTDTSEWEKVVPGQRPFSDGQNPSFVSLKRNPYDIPTNQPRIDRRFLEPLVHIYGEESLENLYLGLLLFGDSQCRWNMTAEELDSNKFSPLQKPPSKRSLVIVMNGDLDPVGTAVLELEHDAPWGSKKKYGMKKKKDGTGYERSIVELDDARLFFHNGRLNVLYRNGPAFGYDSKLKTGFISLNCL
jgi:hypothetical protein